MNREEIYKQALIDIGNRVGSPVMGYVPEIAIKEYDNMQQDISKIVQKALTKQPNEECSDKKEGIEELNYFIDTKTGAACIFPKTQEIIDKINEIIQAINKGR